MRHALLLATLLVSVLTAAPVQQTGAASSVRTFSLYLLGHQIGEERRTETSAASGRQLTFDFKYNDRGTEVALTSTLELGPNGEPRRFVTKGRTYRYFSADAEVTVLGTRAHVRDGSKEFDLDIAGKPFFPLDNYAPIGVHEELIKYWLAHGRPTEILTAPAGPVRISERGANRLAIDGAVWGRETAFVDLSPDRFRGRVAGLFSWAGGLGFEAIGDANESRYDDMVRVAVADRLDDLRAWTKDTATVRSGAYAIAGATVIDGTDRAPIQNATMIVRNGRIAAVGPASSTAIPTGVATVDAKGQFIVPGLWDMHAHVTQIDWFPSYLASGVTTIRDMGGEFEFLKPAKDAIAAGALAPRLVAAGLIDGPGPRAFGSVSVSMPEEARAAVRKYHDAGFEQIKVYIIVPPALVPVITDEAHKLGMTVTGHVPTGMTAQQVVEQGFDSIAHMQLRGQPGSQEAAASIAFFKQHGTVMDPTQSWNEFLNRSSATPLSAIQRDANRLPPALARLFDGVQLSNTDPAALRARQLDSYRLLKQAVDAGLQVVAGTDKGVPGMSLQRELELYVMGGMTPLQAIQSATIVPARVMKLDKDVGTLEVGKRADFVVLGANPLENISAIRDAKRVATNGRLYDTGPLWKLAGFQ
jgi:imidazolonepropionase-like amidohydrolase